MSEISEAIQAKCLAFSDRVIKLNDYLLKEAASKKSEGGSQKADRRGNSQPSYVRHQTCRIPVHLQAIATLCNQLLRAGTSIGAKQLLEQRTPSCSHIWLSRDKSQRS